MDVNLGYCFQMKNMDKEDGTHTTDMNVCQKKRPEFGQSDVLNIQEALPVQNTCWKLPFTFSL